MTQNFEKPQVVFGLGTGRCGTQSLACLLNEQENAEVYHEKYGPHIHWHNAETKIEPFMEMLKGLKHRQLVGDVALYYLPYVEYILRRQPKTRFICMQRNCEQVIHSFLNGPGSETKNHWMAHDGHIWKKDPWDLCFPNYDANTKEEAVGFYWDHYYTVAYKLQRQYPNAFQIFPTEALNSADGQKRLLSFIGIHESKMRLHVGIRKGSHVAVSRINSWFNSLGRQVSNVYRRVVH